MPFDDLEHMSPQRIWDGVVARSVVGERLMMAVVELEANASVPEHAHEHEQLGMVLQGSLTFRIADDVREIRPGGTWAIPSNVPHAVDVGAEGAVVIDVFAPVRSDWHRLEQSRPRKPRWP